jgi:cytochrome c oxidase subunit 2
MNKVMEISMSNFRRVLAMVALMAMGSVGAESLTSIPLNMTQGVTEISRSVYGLHMTIFWVCVAIGGVVFGVRRLPHFMRIMSLR